MTEMNEYTCLLHGDLSNSWGGCRTFEVLNLVEKERERQFKTYGPNRDLKIGFGQPWIPECRTVGELSARDAESLFRRDYEHFEAETGRPDWMRLIREEVAELFVEDGSDPERLEAEAIQVAALCVSLVEKSREARGA